MLHGLTPSTELSGGPWFTDHELDSEFISNLLTVLFRYICSCSFADNGRPNTGEPVARFVAEYNNYPTLDGIYDWFLKSGITNTELSREHVQLLLDVLEYDDKVVRVNDQYRAVRQTEFDTDTPMPGFTESPCFRCPVSLYCHSGKRINPEECIYYDSWK